jgi:hypothetical protein
MIINDKFKYPILERVDTDIGRHYLDSNNKASPKCYYRFVRYIKVKRWSHSMEK